jgi:hypothetical protein
MKEKTITAARMNVGIMLRKRLAMYLSMLRNLFPGEKTRPP